MDSQTWNSTVAWFARYTRAAGLSQTAWVIVPPWRCGTAASRTRSGKWSDASFWKKPPPSMPFGYRRRVSGLPARCGAIVSATAR